MKQIKREITTYEIGDGFYVDVAPALNYSKLTEFFLFHETIGVKIYMFGQLGGCDIEELILSNVGQYIELYKADYMD